jgi:hypothetical protein
VWRRVGIQARRRVAEDLDEAERDDDDSAAGRALHDVAQAAVQIQRPVEVPVADHGIGHDVAP